MRPVIFLYKEIGFLSVRLDINKFSIWELFRVNKKKSIEIIIMYCSQYENLIGPGRFNHLALRILSLVCFYIFFLFFLS